MKGFLVFIYFSLARGYKLKIKISVMLLLYTRDVLLAARKVRDVALGLLLIRFRPLTKTCPPNHISSNQDVLKSETDSFVTEISEH